MLQEQSIHAQALPEQFASTRKRMSKNSFVLVRGGGDLATGVALRLHRAGMRIVIAELAQPLAVRRTVSFSEAVYEGHHTVEGCNRQADRSVPAFSLE